MTKTASFGQLKSLKSKQDEDCEDGLSEGQTAIIFEWDDTILASSTLKQYEYLVEGTNLSLPKHLCQKLNNLDQTAQFILMKAKQLGHIYIITNAEEGRVQKTASLYLPRVKEFLT